MITETVQLELTWEEYKALTTLVHRETIVDNITTYRRLYNKLYTNRKIIKTHEPD